VAKKEKPEKKTTSTWRNLSENWKTVVLQGAVALVLGVVVLAVPDLTAKTASILLGALLVVYGVLSLVSAYSAGRKDEPSAWLYVRGGIAAGGGVVVLSWPSMRELTLLYVLAVFAISAGVFVFVTGLLQKWEKAYKLISAAGGLLSVAFGILLISSTSSYTGGIIRYAGIYAIGFGLLMVLLGMGARPSSTAGG